MVTIKYFICFILGACFIQFILPLGDQIISVICTALEAKKSKLNVEISKNNVTIEKQQGELMPQPPTHAIGFQISNEQQWEEDNDE